MFFQVMTFEMMVLLNNIMMYLSTIGFGFAVANTLIGFSYLRDLNELTIVEIKGHKLYGRTGAILFYIISFLCIVFATIPRLVPRRFNEFFIATIFWHTFLGGIIAFIFFTIKFYFGFFKKEIIYKYGKFIGPIFGLGGWALGYFTSNIDFYFYVNPVNGIPTPFLIPNYLTSIVLSVFIGMCLFIGIKALKYRKYGQVNKKRSLHGVAMILHGISFGYEASAKDLVGTPVLYKYVFPKTYQFLERYAEQIGLDLQKLKKLNLNEAMKVVTQRLTKVGLAEELIVNWKSEDEFTIESINCSTAIVRSYMNPEELTNSICPWAILAASLVNSLTGYDLEISPSEFNKIGAKTKLKMIKKEQGEN